MARFSDNSFARLHALWTLEGLESVDLDFLKFIIKDQDAKVRRAAVQIAERFFENSDAVNAIAKPLANDTSSAVGKQLILSLGLKSSHKDSEEIIQQICRKHARSQGVQLAAALALWGKEKLPFVKDVLAAKGFDHGTATQWKNILGNWKRGITFPKDFDKLAKKQIQDGGKQYFKACISCHGPEGKGVGIAGTDMMLAPSLVDSKRVKGDPNQLTAVLLHGLTGPIDGKNYQAGYMAPAHALGINREDRLSELISYLRYVFGNGASVVTKNDVLKVKKLYRDRKTPWTDEELKKIHQN